MKQLILFASVMLSVTAYSQWDVGDYVDENGVETGEIFLHQTSVGKFSKGKKTNKTCTYFLEHDLMDKTFIITVYPFGKLEEESHYIFSKRYLQSHLNIALPCL